MFDQLTTKIQSSFRKITGKTKITEENIQVALREIRVALLEADVNFKVVRQFVNQVKERAVGVELTRGLNPGQQLVKIVHNVLTETLGGELPELSFKGAPSIIMMVGLQGSGKTTSCAKLAHYLTKNNHHPLLVPCDVYRPAAILQLKTVGEQVGVPVFDATDIQKPEAIVKDAVQEAKNTGRDVVIIDTAGRLHIDDTLMDELKGLKASFNPTEIFFVADAMTGQDSVVSAGAFHEALELSGVIMTKLDGDARGGAALSVKSITGAPLQFVGTGEKFDAFERFYPERMASRILGMGDVLSLVERVQDQVDQDEARALQERMMKNKFTLDDFSKSLRQIGRMGDLGSLMGLIPGMSALKQKLDINQEAKQLKGMQAIISSMTLEERQNHAIINQKRKHRIARGSGRTIDEVNSMLKQFMQMKQMMSMMTKPGKAGKLRQLLTRSGMGDFANAFIPGGGPQLPKGMTQEQLMQIIEENGGQIPPEIMQQMAARAKTGGSVRRSRPKVDRKKQKAKRKKGRKRR